MPAQQARRVGPLGRKLRELDALVMEVFVVRHLHAFGRDVDSTLCVDREVMQVVHHVDVCPKQQAVGCPVVAWPFHPNAQALQALPESGAVNRDERLTQLLDALEAIA